MYVLSKNFTVKFSSRDIDGVERILNEYGVEALNVQDQWGHTIAHLAALQGNLPLIQILVENGVPVNLSCFGTQGPKPIHWACRKGHCAVIAALLHVSSSRDARILSEGSSLVT